MSYKIVILFYLSSIETLADYSDRRGGEITNLRGENRMRFLMASISANNSD